ncbi:MAG TPA: outer membrane beta-barrel protein [Woeseiaceae bacterium]|nr:outer membrane beta-barrel protein [Woeseiaceae bacterium]
MKISTKIQLALCCGIFSVAIAGTASAQDRAQTWEFNFGLFNSESLNVDGNQGTSLDVDSEIGFNLGGAYNFTNRLALGFDFGWVSPRYNATFLPDTGLPYQTVSARLDAFSIQGKGTYNFLEGPITPYVELGFGWTDIDSNIIDGPVNTGCWWDPWWGYICAPFYDTYSETVTSWSGALGVRWDINRTLGLKASYGRIDMNTGVNSGDTEMDLWKAEVVWRY